MKTQYLFVTGILVAMGWLAGCSNSDLEAPDYSRPASNAIVFKCQSSWGAEHQTIWNDNSQVGFFCAETQSDNLALGLAALSAGESEGLFYTKIPWAKGSHTFYLYTPYNPTNKTTLLAGRLSSAQSQSGASTNHIEANNLAYAAVTASQAEGPVAVTLTPVLSFLDIAVSTVDWEGWSVESITVSSKLEATLAGDYTFDLTTGALAFTGNSSKSIVLKLANAVLTQGAPFHGYMAIAAPSASVRADAAQILDVQVLLSKEEEANVVLSGEMNLPALTPGALAAVTLAVDEFESASAEDDSIDLSDPNKTGRKVTANCYVAGSAGLTYRFPATVMGNGYTTLGTPDYSTKYPTSGTANGIIPQKLTPLSAKLLWQSYPTLISGVKLRSGQVYFTLNGEAGGLPIEGNAVIAVYSGKDATGDILWSWHIWVTADDLNSKVQTYTLPGKYVDAGTTVVMDRNLGALKTGMWKLNNDNLALGMLYQWGRKDPFPNIDDLDIGGTGALALARLRSVYDADGKALPITNTATNFDAAKFYFITGKAIPNAEIARYPMNLAYMSATTNWLEDASDDLWGNPYTEDISEVGRKSIYDPCPPGYRVPHRYFATITSIDGENVTNKDDANKARWTGQYLLQADIQAQGGNVFPSGSGSAIYPLGGMLFQNANLVVPFRTGKYVGHYQVSMPASNGKNSYRFYFDYSNAKPHDNNARYVGGSVRCMKE